MDRAWGGCGWVESGREHGESAVEGLIMVKLWRPGGRPKLVILYEDEAGKLRGM